MRIGAVAMANSGRLDAKLPFLEAALDLDAATRALARQFPGDDVRVTAATLRRHKPGRRCLIEYEVVRKSAAGRRVHRYLGKARSRSPDYRTYRLVDTLWESGYGTRAPDRISVPRPIAVLPEFNMWLQDWVPGTPAGELLAAPGATVLAARIADAIHKVHNSGVLAWRRHTIDDELEILQERLREVARTHPKLRERLVALLGGCRRLAQSLSPLGETGIHRDFYPDQVLVDGDRLWLLDFDLYCFGDPALDVGNFVAHLEEQALRGAGTVEGCAATTAALVKRFLAHTRADGGRAVAIHSTISLARHVFISTQFAERRHATLWILQRCEQRLAELAGEPLVGTPAIAEGAGSIPISQPY